MGQVTIMTAQDMCGLRSPCKGCPDRKYDCHFRGHCKKYDDFKDKVAKFKTSSEYRDYLRTHGLDGRLTNV